ncbi:hypothetical protein FALBO_11256 [Fusarium albosuccineum]|uniref:Uncharacterized protein n=1 Tax=Fusarium albosuccineum TaxID=1237068 RepID=A0A8H4P493_9HYPO|nr:hypothetical protein FALBO_11256 [Fusarium albosuccineum]
MYQSSSDSSWNLLGPLQTEYSSVVHWISLVCFGLGLMLFLPIMLFIALDLFLWMWRTASNRTPPSSCDPKPAVNTNSNPAAIATGLDKATLRC